MVAPASPAPHPAGWSAHPSHKIVDRSGARVCEWCDCVAIGRTASLPCKYAPADWRNATTTLGTAS